MTNRDDIESALRGVIDPELNADIVELGMVSGIAVEGSHVSIGIAPHHRCLSDARSDRDRRGPKGEGDPRY